MAPIVIVLLLLPLRRPPIPPSHALAPPDHRIAQRQMVPTRHRHHLRRDAHGRMPRRYLLIHQGIRGDNGLGADDDITQYRALCG